MGAGLGACCAASLGLGTVAFGFQVSRTRQDLKQPHGTNSAKGAGNPLYNAVRAHANFIEYAPMWAALMLYIDYKTLSPPLWVKAAMVGVTVSRFLAAFSLLRQGPGKPLTGRFVGAIMTYFFGALLSSSVLFL